jgi:PilZ domain
MAKAVTERRLNQRYDVHLPIHYRVSQKGATSRWGTGMTSDISSNGVSFRCRRPLPVGAHVEMIIDWPARHDGAYPIDLQATGFVVRSSATRAAVRITSRRFRIELSPAQPMGATA